MKKTYHLCLSGKHEVMFRCREDFVRSINCLCLAAFKTQSSLLAYSFMSNHVHICVRTGSPGEFMKAFWYPYNRYFNAKYGRVGRLGEKDFFQMEIQGLYHLLTCIAYVLRNPMHHGVTGTPFGYPYTSIRSLFPKDFGWEDDPADELQGKYAYHHLPSHRRLPAGLRMTRSGMIHSRSAIDFADVEHQFSTARTFLYYMNRLSGEKWEKEQSQDAMSLPPITLENIENGISYQDIRTMLGNEHGRSNYNAVSDVELCHDIDMVILPSLDRNSIYALSLEDKRQIAQHLSRNHHAPMTQIARCLGMEIPK